MSISLADMENAVEDARRTMAMADRATERMARMIKGRLRCSNVSAYVLRDLKKELAKFNSVTGEWKE